MCFAPQRRALFRHLNCQKWSGAGVLCAFWLGNVLRATTACNFSSLIWPAGSAPAALASLLFDPPEPQIIGKTPVFRDFPTFSRICIFFLLTLSLLIFSLLIFLFSLPLPCSAFHLSILSEVWLLNFLRPRKCSSYSSTKNLMIPEGYLKCPRVICILSLSTVWSCNAAQAPQWCMRLPHWRLAPMPFAMLWCHSCDQWVPNQRQLEGKPQRDSWKASSLNPVRRQNRVNGCRSRCLYYCHNSIFFSLDRLDRLDLQCPRNFKNL